MFTKPKWNVGQERKPLLSLNFLAHKYNQAIKHGALYVVCKVERGRYTRVAAQVEKLTWQLEIDEEKRT